MGAVELQLSRDVAILDDLRSMTQDVLTWDHTRGVPDGGGGGSSGGSVPLGGQGKTAFFVLNEVDGVTDGLPRADNRPREQMEHIAPVTTAANCPPNAAISTNIILSTETACTHVEFLRGCSTLTEEAHEATPADTVVKSLTTAPGLTTMLGSHHGNLLRRAMGPADGMSGDSSDGCTIDADLCSSKMLPSPRHINIEAQCPELDVSEDAAESAGSHAGASRHVTEFTPSLCSNRSEMAEPGVRSSPSSVIRSVSGDSTGSRRISHRAVQGRQRRADPVSLTDNEQLKMLKHVRPSVFGRSEVTRTRPNVATPFSRPRSAADAILHSKGLASCGGESIFCKRGGLLSHDKWVNEDDPLRISAFTAASPSLQEDHYCSSGKSTGSKRNASVGGEGSRRKPSFVHSVAFGVNMGKLEALSDTTVSGAAAASDGTAAGTVPRKLEVSSRVPPFGTQSHPWRKRRGKSAPRQRSRQ